MRHLNTIGIATATAEGATGPAIGAAQYSRLSAQGVLVGLAGLSGVLGYQVSDDPPGTSTPGAGKQVVNWSSTRGSQTIAIPTILGPGTWTVNGLIPFDEIAYEWVRLVWTISSGAGGTISARAVLLGWGGS